MLAPRDVPMAVVKYSLTISLGHRPPSAYKYEEGLHSEHHKFEALSLPFSFKASGVRLVVALLRFQVLLGLKLWHVYLYFLVRLYSTSKIYLLYIVLCLAHMLPC